MKRIKWIKLIFAAAACLLIAALAISRTDGQPTPAAGPTTENALAAEQELTRAFRMNDADAIGRLLGLGSRCCYMKRRRRNSLN
jgi:hypothetical protein